MNRDRSVFNLHRSLEQYEERKKNITNKLGEKIDSSGGKAVFDMIYSIQKATDLFLEEDDTKLQMLILCFKPFLTCRKEP